MNYITEIAYAIQREVDACRMPSENIDALFAIYAVLALAKGTAVTAEDVHNAWAVWMTAVLPNHRSIQPFATLSPEVQQMDMPYVHAIHRVVSALGLETDGRPSPRFHSSEGS